MDKIKGYKCINCNAEYELNEVEYICKKCSSNLQVVYDYNYIKSIISKEKIESSKENNIFRYIDLLPVKEDTLRPTVQFGMTPLYKSVNLGKKLGLENLYLKDDGRNASASFKDRASSIAIMKAIEKGEDKITGASTGNAASSLACLSASIGMKTIIFVPKSAPEAKIAQLLVFGSKVITVEGAYDDAFDLCLQATEKYGWYNRNTGHNPYTREGKKTCAYEICEQLNWECPDKVFVSVGDGNIISGIWKGFKDLYNIGFIDKLPKLVACQAENSNAVKNAFESETKKIEPVSGDTIADSISVSIPRDGDAAVKALIESKGMAIEVSDKEILDAIPLIARTESIFAEPAASTTIACLLKAAYDNKISKNEKIVAVLTGNGLKDVQSAMKSVGKPFLIKPTITDLEKIVNELC